MNDYIGFVTTDLIGLIKIKQTRNSKFSVNFTEKAEKISLLSILLSIYYNV